MEKSLSLPVKLLLLAAGGLAVVAGPILFLFPNDTAFYFAWTIKHPLTPVFMGANYAGGIGAVWAVLVNRWSLARVQMPGIFIFAVTQLLATLLHVGIFNWGHPIAWAWLFVYVTSPVATLVLFVLTERGWQAPAVSGVYIPEGDAPLPGFFRPVMFAFCAVSTLIGLALFLLPEQVAPGWAWSLTPLTARVVGGWYLAGAGLQYMLAGQRTLETAKVGLLGSVLVTALQLLGALLHAAAFNGPAASVALYVLFSASLLAVSAVSWVSALRAAGPAAQSGG
jgi:hypothetical protein